MDGKLNLIHRRAIKNTNAFQARLMKAQKVIQSDCCSITKSEEIAHKFSGKVLFFPTWTQTNKKFLFFQHSTTELKAQERLTNNRRVQLKNRFEQWKFSQLFPNVRWWLWLCCEAHVFMLHISVMCSEGWAHLCTTTLYGTAFHEKFNYKHTT